MRYGLGLVAALALVGCSTIQTASDSGAMDAAVDAGHDAQSPVDSRGADAAREASALDAGTDTASPPDVTVLDTFVEEDVQPVDVPPPDPCVAHPCPYFQHCVPDPSGTYTCLQPCDGIACSPPAQCFSTDVNGTPYAMDAYGSPVGVCMDPCATVTCPANQACVQGAHGVPLGVCIDRCDCRNCGNCGSDGTFVGEQAFCGNPSGSPATMACTTPCASNGDGCIPWDAQGGICWPLEGCFSM